MGKNKNKDHISKFNSHDYGYLDTIPLDGIRWELTRRNKEFIQLSQSSSPDASFEIWDKFGVAFVYESAHGEKKHLNSCMKYCDVPENAKPIFSQDRYTPPIKAIFAKDMEKAIRRNETLSPDMMDLLYFTDRRGAVEDFICEMLSPGNNQDTLYIGISLSAKKQDIIVAIENLMDSIPSKNKKGDTKRTQAFKIQLMTYDLKEKYGYDFNRIATTLYPNEANTHATSYPVTKKVRQHYNKADKMIRSIVKK